MTGDQTKGGNNMTDTKTERPGTDVEVFGSNTDVAVSDEPHGLMHLPPARELNTLWKMSGVYSRMPGMSEAYANNQPAVMAALLTAWQLDLPTTPLIVNEFYSWQSDGRSHLYPSTTVLVALAAKHHVELWFSDDSNAEKATAFCQRRGDERVHSYSYTYADAQNAGITKDNKGGTKKNWLAAPDVMLRYRAARRLLKSVCPDVVLGIPRNILDAEPIPALDRKELEARAQAVQVDEGDE